MVLIYYIWISQSRNPFIFLYFFARKYQERQPWSQHFHVNALVLNCTLTTWFVLYSCCTHCIVPLLFYCPFKFWQALPDSILVPMFMVILPIAIIIWVPCLRFVLNILANHFGATSVTVFQEWCHNSTLPSVYQFIDSVAWFRHNWILKFGVNWILDIWIHSCLWVFCIQFSLFS